MLNFVQNPVVNNKIELVEKGKVMKCNTRMRQIQFRVSEEEYQQLLRLKELFKLKTMSQAIRHMAMRWFEIEEKTIIETQRLAEQAAKLGKRIV